jgi:hypothetical protein
MEAFCHRGSARLTYNTETDSYTMRNLNTGGLNEIFCNYLYSIVITDWGRRGLSA